MCLLSLEPEPSEWELSVTSGSAKGYEAPGPLSLVLYGESGVSEVVKVGEEEDSVFKTGETLQFNPEVYAHYSYICMYKNV